jgi:hypothetical protein
VLARGFEFAEFVSRGAKLRVVVEVAPTGGISDQGVQETRTALKELGVADNLLEIRPTERCGGAPCGSRDAAYANGQRFLTQFVQGAARPAHSSPPLVRFDLDPKV